jgi:NAD(P)H-flavin reductase/hemoglobin-like flavoprotein
MDANRLRESWSTVIRYGDAVPAFFYAALFTAHPDLRPLFAVSMAAQRDRLVAALGHIVSNVDSLDVLAPYLQGLGRDHRTFEIEPGHYPQVGDALLATLEHFHAGEWTLDLAADWSTAFQTVANVMIQAAEADAALHPPWWTATVVDHERRGLDNAVLRVRTDPAYRYTPGQACSVQVPSRRRLRRLYSPANRPAGDGLIEFHAKAVPGGQVSTALVFGTRIGDEIRLGAPVGTGLTLASSGNADLLLVAGGTGLAPFKALIEQIAADIQPRRVALVVGARTQPDLYDMPALDELAGRFPWLTVVPALSHDPGLAYKPSYEHGTAVEVALRLGPWHNRDVYVCGSPEMVASTVHRLVRAGVPANLIHTDDAGDDRLTALGIPEQVQPTEVGMA